MKGCFLIPASILLFGATMTIFSIVGLHYERWYGLAAGMGLLGIPLTLIGCIWSGVYLIGDVCL